MVWPRNIVSPLEGYEHELLAGLNELPIIPLHCPYETPPRLDSRIVKLRKQFASKGAQRLKREHNLSRSHGGLALYILIRMRLVQYLARIFKDFL